MRLIATLLLCVGCATTRTDQPRTTPAAPMSAELLAAARTADARRLAARIDASLANPSPAVPEPTPPESIWAGYMVVRTDSVPPAIAILFPEGPEGDVITGDVLAKGIPLRAATASSGDAYWRFPVTRGALLFRAVRVYDNGRVAAEASIRTRHGDAMIIVVADVLDDPSGATTYTPCAHGVCGRLWKAAAHRIIGCEGPGCAVFHELTP